MNVIERLRVPADGVILDADLACPPAPRGVAIVVPGTGAVLPWDEAIAAQLRSGGFATVLGNLVTPGERHRLRIGFDVSRLATRLEALTSCALASPTVQTLSAGYVASHVGAAVALVASVGHGRVAAIVTYRGRPELAEGVLGRVTAPTLLVVERDDGALGDLNQVARDRFCCPAELVRASEAEGVGRLACQWLVRHLDHAPRRQNGTSRTPHTAVPAIQTAPADARCSK